MTDKFYEKTLATEREYTGRIISVDLLDIKLSVVTIATPSFQSFPAA